MKLDDELRLIVLEKVGIYSKRFSAPEPQVPPVDPEKAPEVPSLEKTAEKLQKIVNDAMKNL